MDLAAVLNKLDEAISNGRGIEGEAILKEGIASAIEENDNGILLQLLNELLGYYREYSRVEESYQIADNIRALLSQMGLEGSIPYATSLLNIANAYRAGGRLDDSMAMYEQVKEIYDRSVSRDSIFRASFLNNKALLSQEMGNNEDAVTLLMEALSIVEKKDAKFEIAVTHSNLANSYMGLGNFEKAFGEALLAKKVYEEIDNLDPHYASCLYVAGICSRHFGNLEDASKYLNDALSFVESNLGKNEFYYRIADEIKRLSPESENSGMAISKAYYEECLAPVIDEKLSAYKDKIAVGLIGKGSDCFGYDDELSRDHDWGPDLCIFVSKETYEAIGDKLEEIYVNLPKEYRGYKKAPVVSSHKRRGVFIIEDFFKEILGIWPVTIDKFPMLSDYNLAECVNGQLFTDPEKTMTNIRKQMAKGYPMPFLFRKLAQAASMFSQCGQYNYIRMAQRGDELTAQMMLNDAIKQAMKLAHYIENKYPPHDKWLHESCKKLSIAPDLLPLLETRDIDGLGKFFAQIMYQAGFISDTDDYLDHHAQELVFKADISMLSDEKLVEEIVKKEFEAFDQVRNEGGRASCQNDFKTFKIMRSSQYMTWNRMMLMQYYYDFVREFNKGHNLITEKYGRMMASTAPERYEEIKDNFPDISKEKESIIESIVKIQVDWMNEFAKTYPKLADDARSISTSEDSAYNTSYETYLRGEISTYSDRMLEMYGRFIANLSRAGKNLAKETIVNTVKQYGYDSLEKAEAEK
ncbi:MAG: DUF4125 family protein [Lachnospiraceae bacterium]|nr:DUF4125 family protein [Lachnospiraceae bacterium]